MNNLSIKRLEAIEIMLSDICDEIEDCPCDECPFILRDLEHTYVKFSKIKERIIALEERHREDNL